MNEDVSTEKSKGTSEFSWHKLVKIPEVNFGLACKTVKVTVDKANVFRLILIHLVVSCGKLKRVESWRWSVFLLLFF